MKVYKFGGASVKDAPSVMNILKVLQAADTGNLLIVVSAMGKTTNALEAVVQNFYTQSGDCEKAIDEIRNQHIEIVQALFSDNNHKVYNDIEILFSQLQIIVKSTPDENYNKVYDQIVSYGELISTKIISNYLNSVGYKNTWLDARRMIRTNKDYRFAQVDFETSKTLVKEAVTADEVYITQGFIGADEDMNHTTLGREGSDYSASVLAYILDAQEVVIWKDVFGVLNGDPKVFEDTQLLNQLSYREAIELAYYGASVIHPKTIQPLQHKEIPLRVKSFLEPKKEGTSIQLGSDLSPKLPCYIKKDNQILISLATRDLAFIAEEHLSKIYKVFHQFGVRINMSQNTAVSSSFCINYDPITHDKLIAALQQDFELHYNKDVCLYTVRHYDEDSKRKVQKGDKVLLEQISRNTYQVITA